MIGLLCFSCFFQSYAQNKNHNDTSWNLICLQKSYPSESRIIRDRERVIIKDSFGNKHRGYLLILNDSMISVNNDKIDKHDTIYLNTIDLLKHSSAFNRFIVVYFVIAGIGFVEMSILFYGLIDGLSAYFLINGILSEALALAIKNGRRFDRNFTFKTYQAKGFKLQKKHLRYLYPEV